VSSSLAAMTQKVVEEFWLNFLEGFDVSSNEQLDLGDDPDQDQDPGIF